MTMMSPVMTRPTTPQANSDQGVKILSLASMARFMSPNISQSTGRSATSESTPVAMTPL
jgi:hypothetical protein